MQKVFADIVRRISSACYGLTWSTRLDVATRNWGASFDHLGSKYKSRWEVGYSGGDEAIPENTVALAAHEAVLVVGPSYLEADDVADLEVFRLLKERSLYELEMVGAAVPSELITVSRRLDKLVGMGLLPESVMTPFQLRMVKAFTMRRVYAGTAIVGNDRHPVWKIKEDVLPEREPDQVFGDLEIHLLRKEEPIAKLGGELWPIQIRDYKAVPYRPELSFMKEPFSRKPDGGFYRDGKSLWFWVTAWAGKAQLRVENGERSTEIEVPEDPVMMFTLPEPEWGRVF